MTRPWHKLFRELEATEGHYSDFVAWERWFDSEMERIGRGDSEGLRGNLDAVDQISLYCLFCEIYDKMPGATHD